MSNPNPRLLTWVEIDRSSLFHNICTFRKLAGPRVILTPSVKANAYGHEILEVSRIALQAGANWLAVNALFEAEILRNAGIKAPIYVMGYVMKKDLAYALELGCRLVVYNKATTIDLADAAEKLGKKAKIHLKVETGNNRQGIAIESLVDFAKWIKKKFPMIEIEGIATHFANIEDTKKYDYARLQLKKFRYAVDLLERNGIHIPIRHCANSAATLLFPETHFEMVRPGIAIYGLWPSAEIFLSMKKKYPSVTLKPVLSWRTRVVQIKDTPKGAYIGYGCTYRTTRRTRLAIIPVGYYDGYDRGFSNKAHVLIRDTKCPVRGRVCMNITMIDITNVAGVKLEDQVTLLGKEGKEEITAECLADLIGTINYEITTRIQENIPRIVA